MRVNRKWAVGAALGVGVLAVGIAVTTQVGARVNQVPVPLNTAVLSSVEPPRQGTLGGSANSADDDTRVFVHVVGGVAHPGLYRLESQARVIDAVMAAGGLGADGSQCGINLARPVRDGEQVVVPQAPAGTPCQRVTALGGGDGPSATVSLSSATVAQLDALPGIGPALAQRIVDYRESHGGFTSVDQLDAVSGIGPKLLGQLGALVQP